MKNGLTRRDDRAICASNVLVEAYAGYKGEETPRAFTMQGVRYEVREIVARWYTERHAFFKLRVNDGHNYVLRYDQDNMMWELVMQEKEKA